MDIKKAKENMRNFYRKTTDMNEQQIELRVNELIKYISGLTDEQLDDEIEYRNECIRELEEEMNKRKRLRGN